MKSLATFSLGKMIFQVVRVFHFSAFAIWFSFPDLIVG
tara:strand:- start:105 stop:218 length:114 start_codon:yes stop_codon:yes gene_type:complete